MSDRDRYIIANMCITALDGSEQAVDFVGHCLLFAQVQFRGQILNLVHVNWYPFAVTADERIDDVDLLVDESFSTKEKDGKTKQINQ